MNKKQTNTKREESCQNYLHKCRLWNIPQVCLQDFFVIAFCFPKTHIFLLFFFLRKFAIFQQKNITQQQAHTHTHTHTNTQKDKNQLLLVRGRKYDCESWQSLPLPRGVYVHFRELLEPVKRNVTAGKAVEVIVTGPLGTCRQRLCGDLAIIQVYYIYC